ncbi:bacteriocin-protection, YdeI or OmpD-associated-domain-containing protein [Podospora fimiseda]|uniref:Bacteriocin-protection, YdeI or OmpD-associated-domain-containing protein n=1 Tax=Podospora fimiseda TaxID=252190 RepID=A0AAN7BLS8_9PEZI|nr:bacteriocin-protection, YdeI or OmpD-associated-domain-containing protein [Podospora fimiseda]
MSTRSRAAAKAVQAAKTAAIADKPSAISKSKAASSTLPIHLFPDANAFESWLETNHGDRSGIWLKIGKKGSGIASVSYDEAIDTALCFGWIDGQRKGLDAQHFLQRFTPRRKNSIWSKRNVDKVGVLVASGRMREPGQIEVDMAKGDGRWEKAYSSSSTMKVPADFEAALDQNKKAKTFFESLNRTKRYPFLWKIETAKRAETRSEKIVQFVKLLAEGKTL